MKRLAINIYFLIIFLSKMIVGGLLEDIKVGCIAVPPGICMVINTSGSQPSDLVRHSKYVYWIIYEFSLGSFPIIVHIYECMGAFLTIHIAWSLLGK